jgi:2-methylcitrate dehydratase PrpD
MLTISEQLAQFTHQYQFDQLPKDLIHEAKRSLLNYFAVCIAAYRDPTIQKIIKMTQAYSGAPTANIIGWNLQMDMLNAASINAMAANVFDFDDTHIPTIIHPTSPVASALLAYSQGRKITGSEFLLALILGMEFECRIGNAISPYHYNRGWHITSTCGVFGAAIGVGKLLNLNQKQYIWALGSAANQSCGLVECLGTMSKSLSVGNASKNGLMSALLAADDFDGPLEPLNGERGFLKVFGEKRDPSCVTHLLGQQWETMKNSYKPYPCGVVLNPLIEACLNVYEKEHANAQFLANIKAIRVFGNPLLKQRADRPNIRTGRQSQVSGQHAISVALHYGKAGLKEFSDAEVNNSTIRAFYPKISFIDEDKRAVESIKIQFICNDREFEVEIVHAKGSLQQALTDKELEDKFVAQLEFHEIKYDPTSFFEKIWNLEHRPFIGNLVQELDFNQA